MHALKLRKQIATARTLERRKELFRELPALHAEIVEAIDRAQQAGDIVPGDAAEAGKLMGRLFTELYKGYEEYEEVKFMIDFDEMLREHKYLEELRIHAEEAEQRAEEAEKRNRESEKRNRESEKRNREVMRQSIRNFKALGLPDEQIAAAMGLSLEEVVSIG
ncbi:hypothetical protein TREPR_1753 [Treponema primitia ZAS-2]|uniref:Uncharacterized protein n=2 Tax=Treponema primitia TaxID=88058 RepID=F5YM34_TREPZ|nr:hypothetical protein TREPR_1753 [Treponema primitia ZAS-2]